MQVIFRLESGDISTYQDCIQLMLENVSVEKGTSLGYSKLGASLMKIKSIESLTDASSPLASLQNSMDNLTVAEGPIVVYQDENTLVYNMPLTLPDLLDDDGDSVDGYSSSKRIKVSVSLFQKNRQEHTFNDIEAKTRSFGNIALRHLLQSTQTDEQPTLTHVGVFHKTLELVNPLDAAVSLIRLSETQYIVTTSVSPTSNLKDPLDIEFFTVSASSNSRSPLLGRVLQVQPIKGMDPDFPIKLAFGETFCFCNSLCVFEPSELIAFPEIYLETTIRGQYDSKPICIELALPLNIGLSTEDMTTDTNR